MLVLVGSFLGLNIFADYFAILMWVLETPSYSYFELYSIPLCWIVMELYKLEIKNTLVQRLLLMFQVLYTLFALYEFRHIYDEIYNDMPYTILSISLIMLSIYYFYDTFIRMEVSDLQKHPMFWINSAILVYFAGTLFVTLFENILGAYGRHSRAQLFLVQNTIAIIFNLIMARGTWGMKRV